MDKSTRSKLSRRAVLAAGAAAMVVPRHVLGGVGYQAPSDKLRIACIGVGGVGQDYVAGCKSEEIVALCDLDHELCAPVFELYPKARTLQGLPPDVRQGGQELRCPDRRHAGPLAFSLGAGRAWR